MAFIDIMLKSIKLEMNILEIKEGYIDFKSYHTYYRIVNPNGKNTPLLFLHGGPGSTHNSFELLDKLAILSDRPLIMYDQLGCGLSSRPDDKKEIYNKDTWVEELINLRNKLHLDNVNILGHSWGGMLLIIYLCDYNPKGINSAILSSTLSSVSLWREETHKLLNNLSPEFKKVLLDDEAGLDVDKKLLSLAYKDYTNRFIFSEPQSFDPECLSRVKPDSSVSYITAWGKSEFSPTGNLSNYEYTDKLKNIKCPVLILSGEQDESTPFQNKTMYDNLETTKSWVLFQYSRHRTYYDQNELYIKTLNDFLSKLD